MRNLTIETSALGGKKFTIQATKDTTINNIKELIYDAVGIPHDTQRLFFAGKKLEDCRTLAEYNVPDNATLELRQRYYGTHIDLPTSPCYVGYQMRKAQYPKYYNNNPIANKPKENNDIGWIIFGFNIGMSLIGASLILHGSALVNLELIAGHITGNGSSFIFGGIGCFVFTIVMDAIIGITTCAYHYSR